MADAMATAFSSVNAAPFVGGDDGLRHDRNSLYLSIGAQPGAGDRAALVLPQPVPRFARQASMPRIHQFVKRPPDKLSSPISAEPNGGSRGWGGRTRTRRIQA